MIKAIVFDWGGVLAPSDREIAAVRLAKNYDLNKQEFEIIPGPIPERKTIIDTTEDLNQRPYNPGPIAPPAPSP